MFFSLQKMKDQEDILRKKQDEVQATKSKLSLVTKKEGNNYLTRDFTDDIYDKEINHEIFVSASGESTMFTDLLVVLQGPKIPEFAEAMKSIVGEYYTKMDEMEVKRFPDMAKNQTSEMVALPEHAIGEAKERVLKWAQANGVNTEELLDFENKDKEIVQVDITSDSWA